MKLSSKGVNDENMDLEDDDHDGGGEAMEVDGGVYDYEGRDVVFSETIGVETLALLLASSVAAAKASTESIKALLPKEGSDLGGRELCTLYPDSHCFQKIKARVKVSYNLPPSFQFDQKFHVLSTLAQGSTKALCGKRYSSDLMLASVLAGINGR